MGPMLKEMFDKAKESTPPSDVIIDVESTVSEGTQPTEA